MYFLPKNAYKKVPSKPFCLYLVDWTNTKSQPLQLLGKKLHVKQLHCNFTSDDLLIFQIKVPLYRTPTSPILPSCQNWSGLISKHPCCVSYKADKKTLRAELIGHWPYSLFCNINVHTCCFFFFHKRCMVVESDFLPLIIRLFQNDQFDFKASI